jgi:hypothetical protein
VSVVALYKTSLVSTLFLRQYSMFSVVERHI